MYYDRLYRLIGLRRLNQIRSPAHAPLSDFTLPRNSVYHYVSHDGVEDGPDAENTHIKEYPGRIVAEHIQSLSDQIVGSPIPAKGVYPDRLVRDYHQKHKMIRRLRDFHAISEDEKTLIVTNFAHLNKLYRYRATIYSPIEQWLDRFITVFDTMQARMKDNTREHFIELPLPKTLGTPRRLVRASEHYQKIPRSDIEHLADPSRLLVRSIWNYLNTRSRENSFFANFDRQELDKLNFLFTESGHGSIFNVGQFLSFFEEHEVDEHSETYTRMQKAFLRYLVAFGELRSAEASKNAVRIGEDSTEKVNVDAGARAGDDEIDEDKSDSLDEEDPIDEASLSEEIERLERQEDDGFVDSDELDPDEYDLTDPEQILEYRIDRLARSGQISTKQQERLEKLLEQSKMIDNPYGEGTLDEFRQISEDEVLIDDSETQLADRDGVFDPSLKRSTLQAFDSKYISKVLDKDIANAVKAIEASGVIVTDFQVEEKEDIANEYRQITLRIQPIDGQQSTVRLSIPKIREDGTFFTNGVKWRMRKQRVDKPIRKVSPYQVALNSYYGRIGILRSQKKTGDYEGWLTRSIIAKGIDKEDKKVTDLKHIDVFDNEIKVPRIYSALAKKMREFKTDTGYHFFFDYHQRTREFDSTLVEKVEAEGLTFIGTFKDKGVGIGEDNRVYILDSELIDAGFIEDILDIDSTKAPIEFAEFSLYNSLMPIALIMGMHFGLMGLIEKLGASYRRVKKGSPMNLDVNEYPVRFADESMIFRRDEPIASLILSSFNRYHRSIYRYDIDAFERRDVYINILEENGFRIGIIREAELAFDLFVDPITKEILEKINEPLRFDDLLLRACELLQTDDHVHETDMRGMRIRGYERVAGQVYDQLVRSVRSYRARAPGTAAKIDVKPDEIWKRIHNDSSVIQVEEANPFHDLKEQESVTYQGTGGRSRQSMVKHTRMYHDSDRGVISESSPDSNAIGTNIFLSANPNFKDLRGDVAAMEEVEYQNSSMVSTSALLSPMSDRDDPKRVNFISIINSHVVPSPGYQVPPLRTGYEKMVTDRSKPPYCFTAKEPGRVLSVDSEHIKVEYDSGEQIGFELGRYMGEVGGSVFAHDITTRLSEGERFEVGDAIIYNSGFFEPDLLSQRDVILKQGMMCKTAIFERSHTFEDSSMISQRVASELSTKKVIKRDIWLDFSQNIYNLIEPGAKVDTESILCQIEDPVGGEQDTGSLDEKTLEFLRLMGTKSPAAKMEGVVDKIEIFYNGEIESMSESLGKVAKSIDNKRIKRQKKAGLTGHPGKVDSNVRIDGEPVGENTAVIRVYISKDIGAGVGDKAVIGHQMKTVISNVMTGRNETESGEPIDLGFSYVSISKRVVTSPEVMGTTNTLLMKFSKMVAKRYFGEE